jgi:GDPmannose 4,6-dehydratase
VPRDQIVAEHRDGTTLESWQRLHLELHVQVGVRRHRRTQLIQHALIPRTAQDPRPPNKDIEIKIVVGNLDVRRDFGYSPRYVEAMYAMMHSSQPDDYLVCSGRSISLREILGHVLERTGLGWGAVEIDRRLFRPTEIADMFGDNTKARTRLDWNYDLDFLAVLDHLIDEEREARST